MPTLRSVAHTPTLTSRLDASRRSRRAAPARRRCTWCRYQRWMVTAAWFTWWMNLPDSRVRMEAAESQPPSLGLQETRRAEKRQCTRPFFKCWRSQGNGKAHPHRLFTIDKNRKEPKGPPLPVSELCVLLMVTLLRDKQQQVRDPADRAREATGWGSMHGPPGKASYRGQAGVARVLARRGWVRGV